MFLHKLAQAAQSSRKRPVTNGLPAFSLLTTAVLLGMMSGGAQAQNQGLGQPVQVDDVLTFEAAADLARHSNIFLLPDGTSPQAIFGDSARGDTLLTATLGVKFDRDVSLQRFTVNGRILPVKYMNYSQFDYVGYDLGANWNWAVGRPWFGTLGANFGQRASSFSDIRQSEKNLQRTRRVYFTGGLRLTPSWALIAGIDNATLTNSTAAQEASDQDFTGVEAGVRYAPGTGTELAFVYRRLDGKYPNRQVVDAGGGVLGAAVDNGFTQDQFLLRAQYKPNEDARIFGEIGLTKRSFTNLAERDFSGPTARLTYEFRPGGRFFMAADLIRDIASQEILTSNYVDTTKISLRPSFRMTGKITLNGEYSYSKLAYEGDPGFVASSANVRKDDVTTFGLRADWQYSRNVLFNVGFSRINRDSNINNVKYTNNIVGIGGRITF